MTDLAWMRPKLAELCGMKKFKEDLIGCWEYMHPVHGRMRLKDWRPDEDVAQAMKCVEASKLPIEIYHSGTRPGVWHTKLHSREFWWDTGEPSRAICLALAAALGWEAP